MSQVRSKHHGSHPDFHSPFSFSTVPMNPVSTHGAYIRKKKKKAGTEHFQLSKDNKLKHVCWARVVAAKASMDAKVAVHKQLRAVFKMLASEIMVSGIRSNGKWIVGLETFSKPGFLSSQSRFWSEFYSFFIVWGYRGITGVCSEEDLKGSSRMLAYISHFQNPELEE